MPTARELLEQADALMRRNRSAVADDIPVLTEAVSPPPVLRVPLRPSPESSPVPLADAVVEAGPVPDVIPTLTEKVPPGEPEREDAVLAEGEPSDWLEFEEGEPSITGQAPDSVMSVPEVVSAEALREASGADVEEPTLTEEIELAPAAEAEFDAELGGGQPPEVTPEAPPAPPPAVEAPAARTPWPDTELPPELEALPALAAEAEMVFESPSSVSWNVEAVLAGPEGQADGQSIAAEATVPLSAEAAAAPTGFTAAPATEADEPVLAEPAPAVAEMSLASAAGPGADVSLVPSPAEAFAAEPPSMPEAVAEGFDASIDVSPPAQDAEPEVEAEVEAGAEPEVEAKAEAETEAQVEAAVEPRVEAEPEPGAAAHAAPTWESPFATLPAAIEAPAVAPPPLAAPAPPPTPDDVRWEAMAEEIRMQVLQRIDLFTDTGLREQLGRRLQPIVDRASADLVSTINQHVGELLRAYVAEAIEREIERWRSTH